jgi:hypothetical protein
LVELASDGLSSKRNGRRKAVRVLVNIVLNGNWLLRPFARESWNISHKHLGEVKEILENLVTIFLECGEWLLGKDGVWRAELCDACFKNEHRQHSFRLAELAAS